MELTLDKSDQPYQIHSYEPGKLVINDQTYTQSVILSPTQCTLWEPNSFAELTPQHILKIFEFNPSVIILGTGIKQIFPKGNLLNLFSEKSIGLEVMSTAAACRTYNILAAEGRNVVAALLID